MECGDGSGMVMTVHELYPYTGTFLDVDGGRLHYLDEGKSEDSAQPVMLAVHGNPTWSFYWRKLINPLRVSTEL